MTKPITRTEFKEHCEENQSTATTVNDLKQLLPLVALIPTLEEIVENQKAATIIGKKIFKIIGVISAIIGLIYLIFRFGKEIR